MDNFNNIEWFWNNNNRLPLATAAAAAAGVVSPSSSSFYNSTVLTDVGICVGMRNVNLNCKNFAPFLPRKIQSCCKFNMIGNLTEDNFNYACNDYLYRHSLYNNVHPIVNNNNYLQSQHHHHQQQQQPHHHHHQINIPPHLPQHQDCIVLTTDQTKKRPLPLVVEPNIVVQAPIPKQMFNEFTQNKASWELTATMYQSNGNEIQTQRNERNSLNTAGTNVTAPKKKWIKHYMMGE